MSVCRRKHTQTQWDELRRLWVSEHLLVVRLFPSSWHKPPVSQGDSSTGSQSEQPCQDPPKAVGRRHKLYWKAFHSVTPSESECALVFLRFKTIHFICPKLTSITLLQHKMGVTAAVFKRLLWQVVLSLDAAVHLQAVRQESRGSLMISDTRTSRCSEDMNKTCSPSDHRPETFRVPNEIRGVISFLTRTHTQNPFVS